MSLEGVKFRERCERSEVVKEIEEDIAEKTAVSGFRILFEEASPPMYACGGGWKWILGSTRGFPLKKGLKRKGG